MGLQFEFSSGGLVLKLERGFRLKEPVEIAGLRQKLEESSAKILMVEVENLKGEIVWTFPKGHLEKGETSEEAALREVQEETGWLCRILKTPKTPFQKVQYFFKKGGTLIKKQVVWFLMAPKNKTGERDPVEVRRVAWFSLETAVKKAVYKSDQKLLQALATPEGNSRRRR